MDKEYIEELKLLIEFTRDSKSYLRCLEGTCKKILPKKDPCCKKCDKKYCIECLDYNHDGKTCDQIKKEKNLEKDRAEREEICNTFGYKPCPECGILVEKTGGCNRMYCGICHLNFCWTCTKYKSRNDTDVYNHIRVCS